MSPHNNFCDTKLPIELDCSANSPPNVDGAENDKGSRAPSAAQDSQAPQHDYDRVLDLIGFGCAHWVLLITCGLLLMMVINETMGMSVITIASQCDFDTTSVDKATMSAASFAANSCALICYAPILISFTVPKACFRQMYNRKQADNIERIALFSYVWGYLSDTIGRRCVLIYATFGGCFFSVVSMFMPNFWLFVFMRFMVGIFIAGPSSTTYAFLGEFHARRHCAIVMNYASLFVGVGMTYVPAIAWLVLSMDWSFQLSDSFPFRPWRLLMFFNLLPGLIAAFLLLVLPESPKLLLSLRKGEEALAAVNWICRRNTGRDLEQFGVKKIKAENTLTADKVHITSKSCFETVKHIWQETRPLLHRPYVLNFLMCCVIMCGLFFSSSGMGLWFTEIQNRVSMSTDEHKVTICEIIADTFLNKDQLSNSTKTCVDDISDKSYIDSISLGLCFVVGYLLIGGVIKFFGRKATIIGSMFLSTACCVALFWLLDPIAIVVCFIVFLTMPGLCISMLGSGVVDLVPTHLRGKAVCICLLLGRTGSIFGSNIIGVLLESYCQLTFGLFTGCVLVCMLLTATLPI